MTLPDQIAIAGIHTGIGKTIVSAILAEALSADYWKPVQAGGLDESDSKIVSTLVSNSRCVVHREALQLQLAASPHTAQLAAGIHTDARDFSFPETSNTLLIETAGGLLSPIDSRHTMADFLQHKQLPAFLVMEAYLGSINHTLLCLEVMKQRAIPLLGLIVNRVMDNSAIDFIKNYTNLQEVLYVTALPALNKDEVKIAAQGFRQQMNAYAS